MVASGDEITAADITDLEDLTIRRPAVRLVQAVVQSMPDNTQTALTFTTEELDDYGFHDVAVNNTRITPTVAGWYRFTGAYVSGVLTTPVSFMVILRKNGTNIPSGFRNTGLGTFPSSTISLLAEMNGTTDYMEMTGIQDSAGATNTAVTTWATSMFECEFVCL